MCVFNLKGNYLLRNSSSGSGTNSIYFQQVKVIDFLIVDFSFVNETSKNWGPLYQSVVWHGSEYCSYTP